MGRGSAFPLIVGLEWLRYDAFQPFVRIAQSTVGGTRSEVGGTRPNVSFVTIPALQKNSIMMALIIQNV